MRSLQVHVVLVGNGNARKRPDDGQVDARFENHVDLLGGVERSFLGRLEVRVHFFVLLGDARQRAFRNFTGAELAVHETRLYFADAHLEKLYH